MRLLADLFIFAGALFSFLGALGLIRMPDAYNRIQAGSKAVTLGALSLLLGIGILYPDWWAKLLCIAGFILFTNPVGSSTIARTLYRAGVPFWQAPETSSSSGAAARSETATLEDKA